MESKTLPANFSHERKTIYIVASAQAAVLLLGVILAIISWRDLRWVILGLAFLSLAAFAYLAIFLFLRFRSLEVVVEKRNLTVQRNKIRQAIRTTESEINRSLKARESITKEEERRIARRKAEHEQTLSQLANKREEILGEEAQELASALNVLQEKYYQNGLRQASVVGADISGAGMKMKERLMRAGILCAADVSAAKVSAVKGFGEAKTLAVMQWRRSVENMLNATKPRQLSLDHESQIKQGYAQQIQEVYRDKEKQEQSLVQDIEQIELEAVRKHEDNDRLEVEARERLEELIPQKNDFENRLRPYQEITFSNFLRKCLPQGKGRPTARQFGVLSGIAVSLVLGLCWQSVAVIGSMRHIYIASIPTFTPTFTSTSTRTVTPSPTNTFTSTMTLKPTITETATISLTPTITDTPTITLTPSVTLPHVSDVSCIPEGTKREVAIVMRVIDGDTIRVLINGVSYSVRYIGVDSPESPAEHSYDAWLKNHEMVGDQIVTLIMDVSETDQYDRLLRYVVVGDKFVNLEMVKAGFAEAISYPPDTACNSTFNSAESTARSQKIGIWVPVPTRRPTATSGPGGGPSNCHPSYPTVCIPPPPPDLDCKDIPYRRFPVVGSDPHRFDGDNDGIGCES